MTEEEKLDAGLYYDFWDAGVNGRKLDAIKFCRELRKMQDADASEEEQKQPSSRHHIIPITSVYS